ncbi:MAG: GTPase HflX, partial [Proteobacteria bacterium]|nr:GTPase HflX [Pseudomonadota bacterium]
MSESPVGGSAGVPAILVQLDFGEGGYAERLDEFRLLASSAGTSAKSLLQGKRHAPDAATYAGKGKVEEIAVAVRQHLAEIVIFNHELSAGQQRTLENALACRV